MLPNFQDRLDGLIHSDNSIPRPRKSEIASGIEKRALAIRLLVRSILYPVASWKLARVKFVWLNRLLVRIALLKSPPIRSASENSTSLTLLPLKLISGRESPKKFEKSTRQL